MKNETLMVLLLVFTISSCSKNSDETNLPVRIESNYTSWGVDEYELFDLTKEELDSKFAKQLTFLEDYGVARVPGVNLKDARFGLTFKDNKVSEVRRFYRDGNKEVFGRGLNSKKEALEFAINGLSNSSAPKEKEKLEVAKKLMAEMK